MRQKETETGRETVGKGEKETEKKGEKDRERETGGKGEGEKEGRRREIGNACGCWYKVPKLA